MGIRIEQPGGAESAARAGAAIGEGKRAEEDRARLEREQVRKEEEKARMKAQKASLDWEIQKMQMNSQMAYEREMRQQQYQLAAEDRAAAWEIEKAEISSRIDFEREEQERQRKLGAIDAERAAWEKEIKDGHVNKDELAYRNAMSDLKTRELNIKTGTRATPIAAPKEPKSVDVVKEATVNLDRMDDVTQILSSFKENVDVNPGLGKKIVPLGTRDKDGKWVEATESEKQLYEQAKIVQDQLIAQQIGGAAVYPAFIKGPIEQQKYDVLISRGWTPDAIRDALGR